MRESSGVSRRSPHSLPEVARMAAWSALWQRLLQPVPDNTPEPEPREQPDDELAAEDEEPAA